MKFHLVNAIVSVMLTCSLMAGVAVGQSTRRRSTAAARAAHDEQQFGPVVRAYLGYLRAEQEVVDDRVSRHEISPTYYRRNSNRIRALRQMALRLARETHNDYLPELDAVTVDELGTLFESPPNPVLFRAGAVVDNSFRFLGAVRVVDTFYVFARLDIYEQAELLKAEKKHAPQAPNGKAADSRSTHTEASTPPRR